MKKFFTLLFLVAVLGKANAQFYWDFTTAAPTGTITNVTVDSVSVGNNNGTTVIRTSSSASSGYTNSSGTFNAGAAVKIGSLDVTTTNNAYFQVNLVPAAGYNVTLTGIQFGARSTSTGPQAYSIRTNKDAYATELAGGTMTNTSVWTLFTPTFSSLTKRDTLTVRIYGYNGSGNASASTANWRIDDLTVTATAISNLPITLTSFTGNLVNGNADLNWTVAEEVNASGYSVERSANATDFSAIGFVSATNAGSYSYTDVALLSGVNYYRLKLVDKDGSFKYSNTTSVVTGKATTAVLGVYPNPVVSIFTLAHPLAGNNATIKIVSIDGKNILNQIAGIGATQTSVDVTNLVKGTYIVVFENNGSRTTTQFIK